MAFCHNSRPAVLQRGNCFVSFLGDQYILYHPSLLVLLCLEALQNDDEVSWFSLTDIQGWPKKCVLGCVLPRAGTVARSSNLRQTFLANSVSVHWPHEHLVWDEVDAAAWHVPGDGHAQPAAESPGAALLIDLPGSRESLVKFWPIPRGFTSGNLLKLQWKVVTVTASEIWIS